MWCFQKLHLYLLAEFSLDFHPWAGHREGKYTMENARGFREYSCLKLVLCNEELALVNICWKLTQCVWYFTSCGSVEYF